MSNNANGFCWYWMMATDAAAAAAFYRTVVGWGAEHVGQNGTSYTLLTAGGHPVAGLSSMVAEGCEEGAKPGWVGYVAVGDADAAADRVAKAGGTVRRAPEDIPGVGRFAVVADPQGAGFMLFEPLPGSERPVVAQGTPGRAEWHELHAADRDAAFDFYAGQFGWTKAEAFDMGPMGTYQLFAAGDTTIGGMMTKMDAFPTPFWLYYFGVDAIDAAIERITANGGQILHGPAEVPGGAWIVQALDPQGAMFALVGPRG